MINHTKSGQITIMLVIIIMVLTTLTTAAVAVAISTSRDTTILTQGERALMVAESAGENALLHLLRDPSYAGESGLSIGGGSATIEVTGTSPKIIVSTGVVDQVVRTIEIKAQIVAGQLSVSSWQEL